MITRQLRTSLLRGIVSLALSCGISNAADFLDDFSVDTSANYSGSSTYGSGGSFTISEGTLNVDPAKGNTYNVFHNVAQLEVGEFVRCFVPVGTPSDFYLTVSSTTRGPNTGLEDGIRLNLAGSSMLSSRTYRNGAATNLSYAGHPVGWVDDLTLYIIRDTATRYRVGYDNGSGAGVTILDTITINETSAQSGLFIGVEGYAGGVRKFDNLQIGAATFPVIQTFTSTSRLISEPGEVTLDWSTTDAESVSLDGEDVTALSSKKVQVNQSTDFKLLVTGLDGSVIRKTIRVSLGESFSIAAVADPQYADADPRGGREPRKGNERLAHAVSEWNQRELDWGVILGDIIDWDDIDYSAFPGSTTTLATQDWSNTNTVLDAWNQLKFPKYLVLGNHDYYVPHEDVDGMKKPASVYRKFGFKDKAYYAFRHKGFKFVVLEGDNCPLNYAVGTPEYDEAKNYYDNFSGPQKAWWNVAIKTQQLIWLHDQLDESQALNECVVIMCHYPVHTPDGQHSLMNSVQMREILDGYPNMRLWLNGHNHSGGYKFEGTRHHLNLKGMQQGADRWYQLDFSPDRLVVYQAEDTTTPVYDLDISLPVQSLDRPKGYAITQADGDANLKWNSDAAEATSLVIERRHIPTAGAWKGVAVLALPTSKTYTDSPPQSVGEYKYRIRFTGDQMVSPWSQALKVGESATIGPVSR